MTTTRKSTTDYSLCGEIFHIEYSLTSEKKTLEGKKYTSYGVSVKLLENQRGEIVTHIHDITPKLDVAKNLIQLLKRFKVTPMCLKIFVEDFLIS